MHPHDLPILIHTFHAHTKRSSIHQYIKHTHTHSPHVQRRSIFSLPFTRTHSGHDRRKLFESCCLFELSSTFSNSNIGYNIGTRGYIKVFFLLLLLYVSMAKAERFREKRTNLRLKRNKMTENMLYGLCMCGWSFCFFSSMFAKWISVIPIQSRNKNN